ncbi:MAG: S46 family peptidase, partial [Rhodothermales bacterium]
MISSSRAFGLALAALISVAASGCASTGKTADTASDSTSIVVPRTIPRTVPAAGAGPRAAGVDLDTVRAGRFDQGKMWPFEAPPTEYFSKTYGFDADEDWFERARLGALRIPGCSASFVSPNGLVLTNHHCGRGHATSVSREGENILDNGFYAATIDDERQVEGLWADQLVELRDVTSEVEAAAEGAQTDAERAEARQEALSGIHERMQAERGDDFNIQIIPLYDGGIYSAYVFRRYTDVRLVFIPELKIGFFGGDPDNFTYPRYTLDMSMFRVYDGDRPLESGNFFKWTDGGVEEGDAVFAIGNPGATFRLSSVAELEFRRDVEEPAIVNLIDSRLEALAEFLPNASEEERDDIRNEIFSLQNAQKLYRGTVRALNDPIIFARRRDAERNFIEAIERDPAL